MTIWITSDTHFCHNNIIKYENRPFLNSDQMDDFIINKWNDAINTNDLIYHLGDFGLGKKDRLIKIRNRLNGKITLIRGNHDPSLTAIISMGFESVADELKIQYKYWNFHMTHIPHPDPIYEKIEHNFINIHGHIHGKVRFNRNRVNVSCDAWGYSPIKLDNLMSQKKNNGIH